MIDIGEVVVCIDDSHLGNEECEDQSEVVKVRKGSIHRVTGSVKSVDGWGLLLDGELPHTCSCHTGESSWNPNRFRKLRKATTDIFAMATKRSEVDA